MGNFPKMQGQILLLLHPMPSPTPYLGNALGFIQHTHNGNWQIFLRKCHHRCQMPITLFFWQSVMGTSKR
jgi:hypothetical protein